jgi:acetyltransferase
MVWPLLPTDGGALRHAYADLSAESRRQRFLVPLPDLDPAMLRRLVDDVDGERHVALVLVALPEGGEEQPVGIGRLVRYRDDERTAEIAVTVADDWHGRGIGTTLASLLVATRPPQVERLVTEVAADNRPSLAMLRRLGSTTTRFVHPGVLEVQIDLEPVGQLATVG